MIWTRSALPRLAMLLILLAAAGPAGATGDAATRILSPADQKRLAAFDAARDLAMDEAKAGDAAEVKELKKILAGKPQPILGTDIRGTYRCRTIKLGGEPPLTIYDWFACRIDEDDLGYRIVKTSGSQRFSGHFIDDSRTRLLYYGASHYSDEKPKAYGRDADSDQVGYFYKVDPGRFRLELPLPKYESKFDIIELVKR